MEFDPAIALEYAQRISRPRQVGSKEEKIVAQEIKAQLEGSGFRVNFQTFRFSTASEVFLFLEILSGLAIIISTLLALGINPWLTSIQSGLLVFLIIVIGPLNNKVQCGSLKCSQDQPQTWWSSVCWKLGRCYETKNIIATLPDSSTDPSLPHLYLLAHYDSKSQYLPLVVRIALFVMLIAGSLIFAGLTMLSTFNAPLTPLSLAIGILVILSGIPLLFLDYGNDSPGAIDDASGVGLVLHLAETIAKSPQINQKLGISLLITSAEELAVKGAQAYIMENESYLRSCAGGSGLNVLNFDGIGGDGKIHLVGGSKGSSISTGDNLISLLRQSAEELGIP
ncbi:MAG: M28 family peptidase, partial [Chloroflexota bacterium]